MSGRKTGPGAKKRPRWGQRSRVCQTAVFARPGEDRGIEPRCYATWRIRITRYLIQRKLLHNCEIRPDDGAHCDGADPECRPGLTAVERAQRMAAENPKCREIRTGKGVVIGGHALKQCPD